MNGVCFCTDRQSSMYPKVFRKITIIRRNIPPKKSTFVLFNFNCCHIKECVCHFLCPFCSSTMLVRHIDITWSNLPTFSTRDRVQSTSYSEHVRVNMYIALVLVLHRERWTIIGNSLSLSLDYSNYMVYLAPCIRDWRTLSKKTPRTSIMHSSWQFACSKNGSTDDIWRRCYETLSDVWMLVE
jgi:hypothetical protein